MATLRKRADGGPLLPECTKGLVRFITVPSQIQGFRYGVHDRVEGWGISLTDNGRELAKQFHAAIGYDPTKLLTIEQAALLIEKSRPLWLSAMRE